MIDTIDIFFNIEYILILSFENYICFYEILI